MPDIQLRFHKDMLVLSSPIDAMLARQGIDAARDRQYLNLMEPDSISDVLNLELAAGAQCIVATTQDITQARLAHLRMDGDAQRLAQSAVSIVNDLKPQHVFVEIGPCGLPLDASSKASLNENRSQYANAAKAFAGSEFDAFFLSGFTSIVDMKCALMGLAQASDKPVFASMLVGAEPLPDWEEAARAAASSSVTDSFSSPFGDYELVDEPQSPRSLAARRSPLAPSQWREAVAAMVDLGASVVGFETAEPIACALDYAAQAAGVTDRPILAQLYVTGEQEGAASKNLVPLEHVDAYTPDTMAPSAVKLFGAGVQFLRATGAATPAYTGALAATVAGLDVRERK